MRTAAALAVVIFVLSPPAYPQCDQQVFARNNPQLCYNGPLGGFPGGGPPTGGGGSGGLLGTIGRVLHGLTGGIL